MRWRVYCMGRAWTAASTGVRLQVHEAGIAGGQGGEQGGGQGCYAGRCRRVRRREARPAGRDLGSSHSGAHPCKREGDACVGWGDQGS